MNLLAYTMKENGKKKCFVAELEYQQSVIRLIMYILLNMEGVNVNILFKTIEKYH